MGMGESTNNTYDYGMMGGGMWIFFLFILLLFRDGGFGNGSNSVNNDFMYSNITNQLGRIQDQNAYNMNTLQQGLCSLGYDSLAQSKDLSAQLANCCCNTQKELLVNRYEAEKNSCSIIDAIHKEGEATRGMFMQDSIQKLRDELQDAKFGLSQAAQSANLIEAIRPCSKPAYLTCSPYEVVNPLPPVCPGKPM